MSTSRYLHLLDVELRDDNTGTGGIAYVGETLEEFLRCLDMNLDSITDEEVNKALEDCGILTLEHYE